MKSSFIISNRSSKCRFIPQNTEQHEQTEATVDNDIDNIIEEVASKKKGGRKPRKTQATGILDIATKEYFGEYGKLNFN